jgi:hypothetical protein
MNICSVLDYAWYAYEADDWFFEKNVTAAGSEGGWKIERSITLDNDARRSALIWSLVYKSSVFGLYTRKWAFR